MMNRLEICLFSVLNSSLLSIHLIALVFLSSCSNDSFSKEGSVAAPLTSLKREAKFASMDSRQISNTNYVLIVYNSDAGKAYPWMSLRPIGVEWSSDKRAEEVKSKLEVYRLETFSYLAWGVVRGESVICAFTEQKPSECQHVVTVPRGVDAQNVLVLLTCKLKTPDSPECRKAIHL